VTSTSLCLADAQVLIDGARYDFLEPLLATHTIGIASTAFVEVRYYRDDEGATHPIDLTAAVDSGSLTVVSGTANEVQSLVALGISTRLGAGEKESLALVMTRGMTFCTADHLAVKTMRNLGVYERWIPLEDLLASLDPPVPVPEPKYLRAYFEWN
jgi:hypothetical protein